jgi:hypothetical protein
MINDNVSLVVVAASSVQGDLLRILSLLTYALAEVDYVAAHTDDNESLYDLLDEHLSNLEGVVRGSIGSDDLNGLQDYISDDCLDVAYESVKGFCVIDSESSLSLIVKESMKRAYEDIVYENFKLFLQSLHQALVDSLICDDTSEDNGEFPEGFGCSEVVNAVFQKQQYIDLSSFEFNE